MAIVANSESVDNTMAYFLTALKKDWKPNRKAKKNYDQPIANRKPIYTVSYDECKITSVQTAHNNSFLKEFMAKNPNAGLTKKFTHALSC